jgi:hypothetical protein
MQHTEKKQLLFTEIKAILQAQKKVKVSVLNQYALEKYGLSDRTINNILKMLYDNEYITMSNEGVHWIDKK